MNPVLKAASALLALTLPVAWAQPGAVTALRLYDADTDEPIGLLEDGAELEFGRAYSVVAETDPETVGSVRFLLDGEEVVVENLAPYAVAGDAEDGADYLPWTPPAGEHTLEAVPYPERRARGDAGTPRSVAFTVVEPPAAPEPAEPPAPAVPEAPAPVEPEPPAPTPPAPAEPEPVEPPPVEPAPAAPAPAPPAAAPETGPATEGPGQRRSTLAPVGGSGVAGTLLITTYGPDLVVLTVDPQPLPTEEVALELRNGDCVSQGALLQALEPVDPDLGFSVTALDVGPRAAGGSVRIVSAASGRVIACGDTVPAAPRTPPAADRTQRRFPLTPARDGGVGGSVLLTSYPTGLEVLSVDLQPAPRAGTTIELHAGGCGAPGPLLQGLEPVSAALGLSVTALERVLGAEGASVTVAASDGAPLGCAEISP